MNRWRDWLEQADRDVGHARRSVAGADHEWAAFAAQQGAEKAVKALIYSLGGEPWGHSVLGLLEALPATVAPDMTVLDAAKRLDKHYVPTRYPNGFASGHPGKYYTQAEAEGAIRDAEAIVAFCRSHVPR